MNTILNKAKLGKEQRVIFLTIVGIYQGGDNHYQFKNYMATLQDIIQETVHGRFSVPDLSNIMLLL